MEKIVRYLMYFFGLLVILIVAAVILIPRFFDPNDFKPQIVSMVKEKTGRDIAIDGEIKLSVFPWIGVSLGKVVLKELPMFNTGDMLAIDSADVKVKLLPLLAKKVELDRVSLDGLNLNLVKLPNGIANWETLGKNNQPKKQDEPKSTEPDETDTPSQAGTGLAALTVAGLTLKNAEISFEDRTSSQKIKIEKLNLDIDEVNFDDPIPFRAEFLASVSQPQLKDTMKISGDITLNEALDQFTVENIELDTAIEGSVVKDGKVQIDLNSQSIHFDKNTMTVNLPSGLKIQVDGKGGQLPATFKANLKLPKASVKNQFSQFDLGALDFSAQLEGKAVKQGRVEITLDSSAIQFDKDTLSINLPSGLKLNIKGGGGELPDKFNADLQLPTISISNRDKFDLGQLSLNAHAEDEQFPGGKFDAQLKTKVSGDLTKQILALSDIRLIASDLVVKSQLSGRHIIDAPKFRGQIVIDELNAKKLANDFGIKLPEMQDPNALAKFSLATDINATPKSAKFDNLKIHLDDSQLQGQVAVNDFDSQAIAFKLNLDKINIDRYLPPKSKQVKKSSQNSAPEETPTKEPTKPDSNIDSSSATELIPVEAIRKLNMDGKLVIDEILIQGLKAKNVQFSVNGKNGFLDTQQSIGRFYQGSIDSKIAIKARENTPVLKINNTVSNIAIEPLLKELMNKTYISGTANMDARITARGVTEQAITSTLNGQVTANFLDGAIYGINIPKMIRDGISTLQGKAVDKQAVNKTDFSELNMLSQIREGVVTTEKLELKSPLIRILGTGTLDLNTKKLEYRTSVKLVDTLKGQGGDTPTNLTGIPIPLLITGTLDNIRYELDTKAALQEALKTRAGKQAKEKAKAVIEKNKAKVVEKLNKKLGGKLGKDLEKGAGELLKGLF